MSPSVCSDHVNFSILLDSNGPEMYLTDVNFSGGCQGNLMAVSRLLDGMKVADAIDKMDNIMCGKRKTSCANEFASRLRSAALSLE